MTKPRNFLKKIEATVALKLLNSGKAVQVIAVTPYTASTWKRQAIEGIAKVSSDKVTTFSGPLLEPTITI
jgi:hypothetical protein